MGYDVSDFVPCEVCGARAVDVHHIECRGMGGTNRVENLQNLMGVCRTCHVAYGDIEALIDTLKELHALQVRLRCKQLGWDQPAWAQEKSG